MILKLMKKMFLLNQRCAKLVVRAFIARFTFQCSIYLVKSDNLKKAIYLKEHQ